MKKSTICGITGFLLAGVLAAGVCVGGYVSRNDQGKWFGNSDIKDWHWADKSPADIADGDNGDNQGYTGDDLVHVTEDKGIMLMSARIAPEEYATYGIEAQADTAYSIKATVNSDALDKSVVGSIAFKNPSSAWASGKSISDYVVLNQITEYGLDFTLTVKQPFGEPVIFKCASCVDGNVNATLQVDYLKELRSFTATLNPSLSASDAGRLYVGDTTNTIQITPNYGVGTVEGTISGYKTTFTTNDFFRSELKKKFNAGNGTSSFTPASGIVVTGKDFKIGFCGSADASGIVQGGLFLGGGWTEGGNTIATNFIKQYGCTTSIGSWSATAGVSSIKYEITYSYNNEYSKSVSYTYSKSYGFRNDNLTAIKTITNISLDKTNIVVYPA